MDTTSNTVATAFFNTWISRFGAPAIITTDRGSQFEAVFFQSLVQMTGSHHIRTTAYHPEGNGMIERWHRALKTAIKCHQTQNWTEVLPMILLGLRACYKDDIKASAAELVYGTTLKLPGEYFISEDPTGYPTILADQLREKMRSIRPLPSAHHGKRKVFTHEDLDTCTHVFVRIDRPRRPLEPPYEGPYPVIDRLSTYLYKINFKGTPTQINIDRLKPAFLQQEDQETTARPSTSSCINNISLLQLQHRINIHQK
ncbi:hypothetical protein PUN28_006108 [Cardiocondyla obscurior]|uniref:Integrase catalytic domain-containing protein n=1 Tax=Cardiocondyla obscurior TaxID=286306 RepID=A0AAW2G9Q8_9HYME